MSESAVLCLSDLHFGKRTRSYDTAVAERRLGRVSDLLVNTFVRSHERLDELVVLLMGDVNDGSDIYPSQAHHQEITNVEEQAARCAAILANLLRAQAVVYPKVRVECVAGNHGRSGRAAHEAASWDIVTYRYLKQIAETRKIRVNLDGDPFLKVVDVRGHGLLLYHGHEIKTSSSIPFYGMAQRMLRWASCPSLPAWEAAVFGHFHTVGYWPINRLKLFASGTAVSDDAWALQTFGWESSPAWWFFGVSDKHLPTWQRAIPLDAVPALAVDKSSACVQKSTPSKIR